MKKIFMALAALAVFTTANAQTQEKWYGSKEGGFAITFNANPVLNYVGNMFNGYQNGNSVSEFNGVDNFVGGISLTGKYFLKDNLALDLGLSVNDNYNVTNTFDNSANADVEKVLSYGRRATTAFAAKVGAEYRLFPGKRLQPIFGAAVFYQHTNAWSFTKITDGADDGKTTYNNTNDNKAINGVNGGATNAVGILVNVGVEYFIFPQISLGANIDLGIARRWTKETQEDELNPDDKSVNYARVKSKNLNFSTQKAGANVTLNFYF